MESRWTLSAPVLLPACTDTSFPLRDLLSGSVLHCLRCMERSRVHGPVHDKLRARTWQVKCVVQCLCKAGQVPNVKSTPTSETGYPTHTHTVPARMGCVTGRGAAKESWNGMRAWPTVAGESWRCRALWRRDLSIHLVSLFVCRLGRRLGQHPADSAGEADGPRDDAHHRPCHRMCSRQQRRTQGNVHCTRRHQAGTNTAMHHE